jgi:hypothetical protein
MEKEISPITLAEQYRGCGTVVHLIKGTIFIKIIGTYIFHGDNMHTITAHNDTSYVDFHTADIVRIIYKPSINVLNITLK